MSAGLGIGSRLGGLVAGLMAVAVAAGLLSAVPAAASPTTVRGHAPRPAAAARPARAPDRHVAGPVMEHGTPRPLAAAPSIPVGSGPVLNGTFEKFSISDRIALKVNVGSGDALLTTTDITLPEIGAALTLGTSYNSLLVGSGVAVGSNGYGWRSREGAGVQLYPADDGSVTYLGEDGTAGKFTLQSGSTTSYNSPGQFHVTLQKNQSGECGGTGWTMTWHDTGAVMCFSTSGLLSSESDRNDNTTNYSYNSSGQETQVTFTPNGASSPTRTVNVSYTGQYLTGFSESTASTTKNVNYVVNASGDLASLTQADGTQISFGYDSSHDLTSITNGDNVTTTLTYNSSHQVTSITQPTTTGAASATTRFAYPSSTQTLLADPNTDQSQSVSSVKHVTYTVDSSTSLITNVIDQAGDSRSTSYTPFDDVHTYTNGVNGETINTYGQNSGESLTQSQSPTGATTSFAYNNQATATNPTANFQPSSSTDAQGNATTYTYDGAGNLAKTANALAAIAKVSHNNDGTPASSTDPMNGSNSTTYGYNASHEMNSITPPTGNSLQTRSVTYDGYGRVKTVTDGDGNTVTYGYDLADRVTKAAYTGGPTPVTVTYQYDGAGNMTQMTDPSGTTTWTYDGRNLVTSRTATSGGGTLSYGYDLTGNLASVTDGGGTTSYSYSARNLLTQLIDPAGNIWQFAYDADGQRTITWFNTPASGGTATWAAKMATSYDQAGRISEIKAFENSSTTTPVFDTSYCYSPFVSGQACGAGGASTDTSLVQYATDNTSNTTSVYSYDGGNRLTKATNIGGQTYSYVYDSDGNLKSRTVGSTTKTWSYNSANQITSSGYSYDGAGNQTTDPAQGTLSYNDAGQLTQVNPTTTSNGPENFAYAGTGQDQVTADGTATSIVYGLASQTGQPWVQSYTLYKTTGPGPTGYIIHDQQGTPLGIDINGTVHAYVTDTLGSVVDMINAAGNTTASYSYDPYGKTISSSGGTANNNLLGYTGALTDPALDASIGIPGTGYIHLGQRWYNPLAIDRFTTQDCTAQLANPQDGNLYAYAADSPINYTDPTGASIWSDIVSGFETFFNDVLTAASSCYYGIQGIETATAPALPLIAGVPGEDVITETAIPVVGCVGGGLSSYYMGINVFAP